MVRAASPRWVGSSVKWPPEFVAELREWAARWGTIAAQRAAAGVDTQQLDFADMERVAEELERCQLRVGLVPEGEELPARDPRRLVVAAGSYLGNNQSRVDDPRYRRAGLPITSSLVESVVGEFNARVKSPRKFWNRPDGSEPILQLRAAVLSEDDRLERFCAQRPGCPYHGVRSLN